MNDTPSRADASSGAAPKIAILAFEHRAQPLLPLRQFLLRLARSAFIAVSLIGASLLIGMLGYHFLEGLHWIDAFLNASMLLGGMGPVDTPVTDAGKLFAGVYALYCGFVVIAVAGVLLIPIAHRVLHRFHLEGRSSDSAQKRRDPP